MNEISKSHENEDKTGKVMKMNKISKSQENEKEGKS